MQLFAGLIRKRHEELNKIIRLLPSAEARAAHQGEALSAAQQSNKEAAAALAAEVQRGQGLGKGSKRTTQTTNTNLTHISPSWPFFIYIGVLMATELLARVREATQIVGRARFNLDKELKEEEKEEEKKGKGGGGRAAAAAPNDKKRAASDEGDEGDGGDAAGGDDSAAGRKRRRVHSSAPSADGDK